VLERRRFFDPSACRTHSEKVNWVDGVEPTCAFFNV